MAKTYLSKESTWHKYFLELDNPFMWLFLFLFFDYVTKVNPQSRAQSTRTYAFPRHPTLTTDLLGHGKVLRLTGKAQKTNFNGVKIQTCQSLFSEILFFIKREPLLLKQVDVQLFDIMPKLQILPGKGEIAI